MIDSREAEETGRKRRMEGKRKRKAKINDALQGAKLCPKHFAEYSLTALR